MIGCGGYPWLLSNPEGPDGVGNTGVVIDVNHAKKGYGSEAIIATLDYGFDEIGFEMIEQETQEVNEPYRALMKSVGLEPFGKRVVPEEGEKVLWLYRVTREEWRGLKAKRTAT